MSLYETPLSTWSTLDLGQKLRELDAHLKDLDEQIRTATEHRDYYQRQHNAASAELARRAKKGISE